MRLKYRQENQPVKKLIDKQMHIILPKPPSVNDMYGFNRSTGAKYLKKEVQEWYAEAGNVIMMQYAPFEQIKGRVRIDIVLYADPVKRNDIDNIRKCVYDLLKPLTFQHQYGMGVIEDDEMVYLDGGEKIDVQGRKNEKIEVTITQI